MRRWRGVMSSREREVMSYQPMTRLVVLAKKSALRWDKVIPKDTMT